MCTEKILNDIIIVNIIFDKEILMSLGFNQKKIGIESVPTDLSPHLNELKELAYNHGIRILSE